MSGLTAQQLAAREGRLTASRVGVLMSGDPEKVMDLWLEMTGQKESDDLSDVWPVQLGIATEALNLAWYERREGRRLSRHGEVVIHPDADWAACTLDAFDAALPGPVEAKCVGGFESREKVIARYQPQAHWQMLCTGTRKLAFAIIEGGKEPVREFVQFDKTYAAELWARAEAFMRCVDDLVPPVALAPVEAPVAPEKFRTVDMTGSNAWAAHAATWLRFRDEAKSFETSAKELKALVEADVGLAQGHGLQIKRNKAGSLSISAWKG